MVCALDKGQNIPVFHYSGLNIPDLRSIGLLEQKYQTWTSVLIFSFLACKFFVIYGIYFCKNIPIIFSVTYMEVPFVH